MSAADLRVDDGIFIDIEAVPGGDIFALGLVARDGYRREAIGRSEIASLLPDLRALLANARFVAGHNLLAHDLPIFGAVFRIQELYDLPAIDTLYLSPIAFPRNPYHRLAKNDKLVGSERNHPVRDCDSSRILMEDALQALRIQTADTGGRERLALIRWLFAGAQLPWHCSQGIDMFLSATGIPVLDATAADAAWRRQIEGRGCPQAAQEIWTANSADPKMRLAIAYVAAWLAVAGTDSVLPGWVRHQFPDTARMIKRLRSTGCRDLGCPWCSEALSPRTQLKRFFGWESFRPEPCVVGKPDVSLQEEIVRQGINGASVLAILPTGGGKSLCFQVPALHSYYATGALTIVITPLQSLMKDQVDGLTRKTHSTSVAALNGMQSLPEKAAVREAVRLGTVGLLYVSPEQLRNESLRQTILQREIGCWVFDEAHCLSQWGHDFRPDYHYVARFIREVAQKQGAPIPQVICVTATAKEDVRAEIRAHFQQELGLDLLVMDGGASRDNLSYRIEKVSEPEKLMRVEALLREKIGGGKGAAVVFAATRKRTEEFAKQLSAHSPWRCEAFHAGLESDEKKQLLDRFIADEIDVIVATSAFGMGIDKPNIRLVIHVDTPGSLESYIQEAGRAGRDRQPAECVLLHNPADLETQFSMLAMSRIDKRDIDRIWKAIARADRGDGQSITVTINEIVRDCGEGSGFEEDEGERRDTKVKTALAVLEKQGFLQRDENRTKALSVRLIESDPAKIDARLERLDLPERTRKLWLEVLDYLRGREAGERISFEDLAELPQMKERFEQQARRTRGPSSSCAPVFAVLNEMAHPEVGLISKEVYFSASLRVGRTRHAGHALKSVVNCECDLIALMRELEPDPSDWMSLSLRRTNQHLLARGHRSLTEDLLRTLKSLSTDAIKMGFAQSTFELGYRDRENARIRVGSTWSKVAELSSVRHAAAAVLVNLIIAKAKANAVVSESTLVTVEFGESEVIRALQDDIAIDVSSIRDLPAFVQYLLVYLDNCCVLELKSGKALLWQAMTLRVLEPRRGVQRRKFTKGDYSTLRAFYSEKNFQVHVMGEYARLGMERLGAHLRLLGAYFEMGKAAFAERFLREKAEVYERATSIESYRRIVDDLHNPIQQAIVSEAPGTNMLVLAGPGSGKTRVVAHRCAYLLRVERVRPERILVVCFNRHAALQLRRSIYTLVGWEVSRVLIQTYHGLALRLLGRSMAGLADGEALPDFDSVLREATALLSGDQSAEDVRGEEFRDRVMAGFSHVLVDEYQDVDDKEYEFIAALTGRKLADDDRKLAIMAVGDDDQSIYAFKGANVGFIRRFAQDYQTEEPRYLTENYRSTRAIIAVANRLIAKNTDRMKIAQEIRVNAGRSRAPDGGDWEPLDPVARGRVQLCEVANDLDQTEFILQEIRRLKQLDDRLQWKAFAVIGRTRACLQRIRSRLDEAEIAVDWRGDDDVGYSPFRIREVVSLLGALNEAHDQIWSARRTREQVDALGINNRWTRLLSEIWSELAGEIGDTEVPVSFIRDFFVESLAERKRQRGLNEGVVLVTAHKAKGLEFPHVFIADGAWKPARSIKDQEEERRVFYVAMTRAKQTLAVLARSDCRSPFPAEIKCDFVVRRRSSGGGGSLAQVQGRCQYGIIEPKDVFLSYAGGMAAKHQIHRAIRACRTDDKVQIVRDGARIRITTADGTPIAQLSKAGEATWGPRLAGVKRAAVSAMLRRTKEDSSAEYHDRLQVDSWEFPIVEVCWDEDTSASNSESSRTWSEAI